MAASSCSIPIVDVLEKGTHNDYLDFVDVLLHMPKSNTAFNSCFPARKGAFDGVKKRGIGWKELKSDSQFL